MFGAPPPYQRRCWVASDTVSYDPVTSSSRPCSMEEEMAGGHSCQTEHIPAPDEVPALHLAGGEHSCHCTAGPLSRCIAENGTLVLEPGRKEDSSGEGLKRLLSPGQDRRPSGNTGGALWPLCCKYYHRAFARVLKAWRALPISSFVLCLTFPSRSPPLLPLPM